MSLRYPAFDARTPDAPIGLERRPSAGFYDMFRAACRRQHQELCSEVSRGDDAGAARCARRLKASCFAAGAYTLGRAYGRIAFFADRGDVEELRASVAEIEQQLEHTLRYFGHLALDVGPDVFPVLLRQPRPALAVRPARVG